MNLLLRRGPATRTAVGNRLSTCNAPKQVTKQQHRAEAQADEGNITSRNFWRSLESFKAHLRSADFVGFDLELSGIHSFPPSNTFSVELQSPLHQTYHRFKYQAEKFAVFQVGFALFHLDPVCNRFLAYPYNFYVFPRSDLSLGLPVTSFSCEASALEFLASHGFDFNLCIEDGISYLSKTQEAEARALLVNKLPSLRLKSCTCSRSFINTSDMIFAERLRVDIEKWHNSIRACSSVSSFSRRDLAAEFFAMTRGQIKDFEVPCHGVLSDCPSFTLQLENHRQACLAQLVVEKHFEDLVSVSWSECMPSGSSHDVKVFFTKSKEQLEIVKSELEQGCVQTRIDEAIGFRHVIDAVLSSQKPLIGHNCALDLAHIHSKFLSPLPPSLEEFSASVLANFPSIIDTKSLLRFEPSLQTLWTRRHPSLDSIYSYMFKSKNTALGKARFASSTGDQPNKAHISIMDGFRRYQDSDSRLLHEAGYDAFMTGCIFAQICQQLRVSVKDLFSAVNGTLKFTNLLSFRQGMFDLHTAKLRQID